MAVSRIPFILLCVMTAWKAESSKILMLPVRQTSHIMEMVNLAIPLMSRGHEITMVVPANAKIRPQVKESGIHVLRWTVWDKSLGEGMTSIDEKFKQFFEGDDKHFLIKLGTTLPESFKELRGECHGILGDKDLDKKLRAEKFDFVIVDGLFASRCFFLIPHRMNVPYAGFSALVPGDIMSTTLALPSVVPDQHGGLAAHLTFFQRVVNLVLGYVAHTLVDYMVVPKASLEKYTDGKPFHSYAQLASDSRIWMVNQHPMLDVTKPTVPFVINIGGLNAAPAKPLPSTLKAFADGSKDGLVIVSFGGSIEQLPDKFLNSILEAARKLPDFNFLLRNKEYHGKLPKNVMTAKWLPQNDALGHPKAGLFITHCGSGGQHEALYHGVPMLGFPGIADQFYNAARIEQKGYGLKMSLREFTTEELITNLKELLYNGTYRKNIQLASEIVQHPLNRPDETAIYWIEHVIKYGGDHLKVPCDLYAFQIMMWDVFLFLLVVTAIVVWIEIKLVLLCYRKCCAKRQKTKQKKKTA